VKRQIFGLIIAVVASSLTALALPVQAATLSLTTAADYEGAYNRSAFRHWIDADKDGCDTRAEVLIEEALVKPKVGKKCALTGGKWRSQYDKLVTTNASALDIDHLVPLAEAWRSGAWAWTDKQREDFANDLSDSRALVAVSASSNRSKGDKDYSQWRPKLNDGTEPWIGCNYLKAWIAIKMRYQLTVDSNEASWINTGNTTCAFGNSIQFEPYFKNTVEPSPTVSPSAISTPTPDTRTAQYINTYQFLGITYKEFAKNFDRVNRSPIVTVEVIDPPSEYYTEDLNDSCVVESTIPEGTGQLKSAKIYEGEKLRVLVRCRWVLAESISGSGWKWRKGTSKTPLVPTDCAKLIEIEIEGFKALQCVPSPTPSPKPTSSSSTSGGVKQCWVNGYTRSNGTTVKGYYRSC
jgi:hypothetical protein